jgi:membrane peptidoglycan carboxypeptidase
VIAVNHAGALNDMLNSALITGTGRRAALLLHPACGKTGTTQEFRDAWFIGYTAHYVGGVWVGNDDRHPMNRVMGGTLPAKLWHDLMVIAHQGLTPAALPGTMPATPLAQAPTDQAPPQRTGDQPILPLERIEPEFLDRVLGTDNPDADTSASRQPRPETLIRPSWLDRTLDEVRRWVAGTGT